MRLTLLIPCWLFTVSAIADTTSTTSAGNWNTGGNWSNGVPSANDTVTIAHAMTLDADLDISGLWTVENSGSILDTTGGSSYTLDVQNNGTFNVNGDVTVEGAATLKNTATINVTGCDTLTTGAMTWENSSNIDVDSCGVVIVNGNLTIQNSGTATIDGYVSVTGNITGDNAATVTGNGSVSSTGTVTLNNSSSLFGSTTGCGTGPCSYGPTSPLPVSLLSFSVHNTGFANVLSWSTLFEKNNFGYNIERTDDLVHWGEIGFVESRGDSRELREYFFEDLNPMNGNNYYRLSQIDLDNTVDILGIRHVNFTGVGVSANSHRFYPNPSEGVIYFTKPGLNIEIFSITGKRVFKGIPEQEMRLLEFLSPGYYQLSIQGSRPEILIVR